ncbi:uncharacterized protein I206_106713 [Kwoniella pini CBS 10737]|uniref:Uncharacterized protein n=1 Tax=Kwoniella pini CBS 10737 TaxID=1296096 RepID=A0A1B9HTE8_9TREE|nr:uncharacterized protein I206_07398 [Kwoniella pini CBS 10737]OCF46545.1 hypothetical protein I206_07398 [Kwoniella pini CBS 10737]
MQSVLESAKSVVDTTTNLVSNVIQSTGLTNQSNHHQHNEENFHKNSSLSPNSIINEIKKIDSEGLDIFENDNVKHDILVKINKLAKEDIKHGLKELNSLDLIGPNGIKKGIDYYHPLRYFTVNRPLGIDYIGEIEIENVRVHKAGLGNSPTFHSIDTRPSEEGGAVFKTGDPLKWFDY